MMIRDTTTRLFAWQHRYDDLRQLALQAARYPEVDMAAVLQQVGGWQAARTKLPDWAACQEVCYPRRLSMEQCSGSLAADYKARLLARLAADHDMAARAPQATTPETDTGRKGSDTDRKSQLLVDLTGGLGVDFVAMGRQLAAIGGGPAVVAPRLTYVERQEELCALARNNLAALGLAGCEVSNTDAATYLQSMESAFCIFLDPARRDSHGGRVYGMADCEPDVLQLRSALLGKARYVLLKLSPMLDWHEAVRQLESVTEVHIVSVDNDCKELLLVMQATPVHREPTVTCAHLHRNAPDELFCWQPSVAVTSGSSAPDVATSLAAPVPGCWLLEPNASVMKAGCFDELVRRFGVAALSANSHLFVADRMVDAFPGRQFRVTAVVPVNRKELRKQLGDIDRANVSVRNFPMGVDQLRKKLKLKDGGQHYLFATTLAHGNHVLVVTVKA